MNLHLSESQQLLQETFAKLFAAESSTDRVREAEQFGFDPALWKRMIEAGVVGMRVCEDQGGGGAGLLDAVIVAEEAGRRLVSGPLIESIVTCELLADSDAAPAKEWLTRAMDGSAVVTLAPRSAGCRAPQLVPGGAVADAVIGLDGDDLVLMTRPNELNSAPPPNLAAHAIASWSLSSRSGTAGLTPGERIVLARGNEAHRSFGAGLEEWKLLTAASLTGLSREAIEMAARYATERIQFDRPIGSFQAIAHPLADAITENDGARLLVWDAIWSIARGHREAAAKVSMAFAWSAETATKAVARALHTYGGYGVSLEYDIQLYHRRGKAWALLAGDPRDELIRVAERLWDGSQVPLPNAGDVSIDFGLGEKAEVAGQRARRFFDEHMTDELREHAHHSWDGHHPGLQKKLASAGLLFPTWPPEYGGQDCDPYEAKAILEEYERVGWGLHPIDTTRMAGETLLHLGSDELNREVIPPIAQGDAVAALAYTEPHCGSDVAAVNTRAVRDGDDWVIDGQKMFTSGANVAQYVLLLTRTDPDVSKHKGLTLFFIPLDTPGIEIHPVHTLSDERTNITYYSDVRVSDRYRVGDVNDGWAVLRYALSLEHGGGGAGSFYDKHQLMIEQTVDWARGAARGTGTAFDDPRVRERLGHAATHAEVSRLIDLRSLWSRVEDVGHGAEGPMVKLFSAERYAQDASDLIDLAAPDSILKTGAEGAAGGGEIELGYRLSTTASIYGGTSEIMRSLIAELALGMPRSRN